ncbi:F-box WD repeat-containing 7 [Brachionus plicatilis]|uniref:F-box WD repeat-containing 7 n=1 Tax=Brachionus plicatilis TaxID=10195 RepID=A0A3M7T8E3_BRAPC|nr:F-box WD repeat-containing 7 [Brachionus plicatilis]
MASGSKDGTVKIWNLFDGRIGQTLRGHSRGIWCLKFLTKYLLCSGSYDSLIKIWNLKDGTCSRTLDSHTGPVWSIVKCDYFLVSASQDRTAIVWDLNDCDKVNRLVAHKGAIFCVDAQKDLVVTGSSDKFIKLWNIYTGECHKSVQVDQFDGVSSISMSHNHIACACKQTITLWKIGFAYSLELIREFKEHFKKIESIQILTTKWPNSELLMVSGSKDGLIKIWNNNE